MRIYAYIYVNAWARVFLIFEYIFFCSNLVKICAKFEQINDSVWRGFLINGDWPASP